MLIRTVWSIYLSNGYNGEAAKEGEIKQAKAAIQASVDAGVKHIVYSTLDGGLGCVHWDSKSEGVSGVRRPDELYVLISSLPMDPRQQPPGHKPLPHLLRLQHFQDEHGKAQR